MTIPSPSPLLLTAAVLWAAHFPCQDRPADPEWKWSGFEVIGARHVTRDAIVQRIPLELGSPWQDDREAWRRWEEELREEFGFAAVKITRVRFMDGNTYLVVDVIEEEDRQVLEFRDAPTGAVPLPEEVTAPFDRLQTRLRSLFEKGTPPQERVEDGHLAYADEAAQGLVAILAEVVPPHREALIRVLQEDASATRRAQAATLLHWAGDVEDTISRVYLLVDDPDVAVRNNLTRFMLHYVKDLESEGTALAVVGAMAEQLVRPSHGDRNKSIYALLHIAEARPGMAPKIEERCGSIVRRLAGTSILSNVRGPAQELADLLEPRHPADR